MIIYKKDIPIYLAVLVLIIITTTYIIRANSSLPEKKYMTLLQFEQKNFTPQELRAIRLQSMRQK